MWASLDSPGRSTDGKSDGGMANKMARLGAGYAQEMRVREVTLAIRAMSKPRAEAVLAMYDVSYREDPRSEASAAAFLGWGRPKYREVLAGALGWLEARLELAHTN